MGELNGRRIVITGSAGGIGIETAKVFLAGGANVHLVDIDHEGLETAVSMLGAPAAVTRHASMLEDPAACAAALHTAGGAVFAVVHLAGVFEPDPLLPNERQAYERAIAHNLTNAYDIAVAFQTRLDKSNGPARMVMASSQAYRRGSVGYVSYSAAKGGIVGLTRGLARQFAPDVLVNAVAPGIIRTRMNKRFEGATVEGEQRRLDIPLKRFGEASEVAGVIAFLCSSASTFITGQTINIDGGANMS
jgi:3-oxoacyl-[acyl-carrier protein] reductase